ncbi:MAG: hypothetical protein RRY36_06585 [Bacteroidaceae bacterium]
MKKALKYCLLLLILLLCHTAMARVAAFASPIHKQNCTNISQEEPTKKAVAILYYIYTNTPREIVENIDQQIYCRAVFRTLLHFNNYKDISSESVFSDKEVSPHPNPILYYIFALEKIVV